MTATATPLNPYATSRLSPRHLQLLFPATFYQSDDELSKHMSESCLVEQMTWEGDTAVGETAFWLKVLSTPESDYLKQQKRLFKRAIAERCKNISTTYSNPNSNKAPAIIKLRVSDSEPIYQSHAPAPSTRKSLQSLSRGPAELSLQQQRQQPIAEPAQSHQQITEPAQSHQQITEPAQSHQPMAEMAQQQQPIRELDQQQLIVDGQLVVGSLVAGTTVDVTQDENAVSSMASQSHQGGVLSENSSAMVMSTTSAQVVVGQAISETDWQLIEKHLTTSSGLGDAQQQLQEVAADEMEVYDTPTPGFGIKAFRCKLCVFAADNRPALNKHQRALHADEMPYICDQCDYSSKYSWSVKAHIDNVHLKTKRFQCPDCSYATSQACFLRRHTLRRHAAHDGQHRCPYCDYSAHHPNSLQRHVNRQHTHNFAHKCPYCDYGRDCKYLVEDHINDVHLKKVIYQCSECSYQTYKQRSLKSHQKTHLTRDVLRCSECEYRSVSVAGLSRHMRAAHPDANAKAVLAELRRGAAHGSGGGSAVKSDGDDYTAVLMGKCKYCDFTTDNVIRLKSHIRSRHKRTTKVPCPHCAFKATNKKGLRRHLTNQHPEKQLIVSPEAAAAAVAEASGSSAAGEAVTIAVSQADVDSLPVVTMVDGGESANIVTVMMASMEGGDNSQGA